MIMLHPVTECQQNNIVKMLKCKTKKKCQNLDMAMEFNTGLMELITRVNGFSIRLKAMVHSGMLKEMFIGEILKMIWQTDKENILILMEVNIKESSKMMYKKGMVKKNGSMEQNM
jgi:hypothetical protein